MEQRACSSGNRIRIVRRQATAAARALVPGLLLAIVILAASAPDWARLLFGRAFTIADLLALSCFAR